MTSLSLSGFPTVSLEELQSQAELLTRVDRKYLLDGADAAALVRSLDPRTRVLTVSEQQEFSYRSVYFDTENLASYRLAALGRRRRFKVRTRSYLDAEACFLEVKTRDARGHTVKDRIEHDPELALVLSQTDRTWLAAQLAEHGIAAAPELRPALTTSYRRITVLPPQDGLRVTIDLGLTWSDGDLDQRATDLVVVETKSTARAGEIDRWLWRAGRRPGSISKYATCLASLRGDLPDNRWHRTLTHHLPTTQETPCAA